MCKTIRNMYDEKLTFENLVKACDRAHKNKSQKSSTIKYDMKLEENIVRTYDELKKCTYKIGAYHTFTIYEPKEREIKLLQFKDRVVQQWYIEEFIKPYIIPRFIDDTYACIKGKGTHGAVKKMQHYMQAMNRKNKDYYVLKCDIHKYFYNIDKNILYKIMCKYINDKKLLWLTRVFIFDDNNSVGIPIGNYTSQYFANIYLNELDHYVKEKLKTKYYVRYMDDFVILLDTKEECKQVLEQITHFVNSELKLEMNSKSRYYPNKMGIDFCGYRIFNTHLLLRKRCVYNIKKDLRIWFKLKEDGVLNMDKVQRSYNSFLAHAKHASSYNICFIIGNIMALL